MNRLRGIFITGMAAAGKSTIRDHVRALALNEASITGTPIIVNDKDEVPKSLLMYNNERAHIPELYIPGLGTKYFLPPNGEVRTTHGSLFMSNGKITSFNLETISAFGIARQYMLNNLIEWVEKIPLRFFFIIEWGTAENIFLPEKKCILTLDSVDLYESMRGRKLFGKPLTEQFAVMEVHADDDVRALRNAAREDSLTPGVWRVYEKNGGYMPLNYQEKLIFKRIENNGDDLSILQKVTEATYRNIKEQYRLRVEGQISGSRERL